jgi:hypothetical protein
MTFIRTRLAYRVKYGLKLPAVHGYFDEPFLDQDMEKALQVHSPSTFSCAEARMRVSVGSYV